MTQSKESKLRGLIEEMTIEEKAGQLMVVDFTGVTITPHLLNQIDNYNCAGLRIQTDTRIKSVYHPGPLGNDLIKERSFREPTGGCKDLAFTDPAPRCIASQYASLLNKLKERAMNRKHATPLHIVFDQEGAGYENFICGDVRLFPVQMGMAAIEDENTVYNAYRAMAKQFVSAGLNWIHSPVLDVNTNPNNPEIGIRSFSDDTNKVVKYASIMLRAFNEEKLISTAKHFPGRGESSIDAHSDLPTINVNREEMFRTHIYPYKKLIGLGLPSIMIAHSIYPYLEKEPIPATVSYEIITNVLRKELGFNGVITSDNLLMNGLIKKYEIVDAAILAIKGGATLLLPRAESPLMDEIYHGLVNAIKDGIIPVNVVDEAIYHNLSVKYDFGLFKNGGVVNPIKADVCQMDEGAIRAEIKAAQQSVVMLRDKQNILPFTACKKVLLIDQTGGTQMNMNNFSCHPGMFWELFLEISDNVMCVEIDGFKEPDEETKRRVIRRIEEADLIIATNYEVHRSRKYNTGFLEKIKELGKPMVIVTNSPYRISEEFDTVLITFGDNTQSLKAAAEIIYGKRKAVGILPVSKLK